jgi:hypothetical protein
MRAVMQHNVALALSLPLDGPATRFREQICRRGTEKRREENGLEKFGLQKPSDDGLTCEILEAIVAHLRRHAEKNIDKLFRPVIIGNVAGNVSNSQKA